MKDWLILLGVGIVAVFAFQERAWFLPKKTPVAADTVTMQKAGPAVPARLLSPPQAPSAEEQLAPNYSTEKAELAALVGQSQQAALAKYPSLGEATSEMNIRFNYRYKRLLAEYSPRLQDPAWPVQLADECAQAAGVRPVVKGSAATPPPKTAPAPRTALMPPRTVPSAVAPAQSLRVSQPSAAQTLVFHPAGEGAPPGSSATGPPVPSAPPASNTLPFVTLDAVNQSSGNHYTYNWGSYYGWYDISYRQSVGISINLKNMSRTAAAVNVRWIFFARNAASSARFISKTGKSMTAGSASGTCTGPNTRAGSCR